MNDELETLRPTVWLSDIELVQVPRLPVYPKAPNTDTIPTWLPPACP